MFQHAWKYTKTVIDINALLEATRNDFKFVAQKPYQSKKNPEDKGVLATLLVIHDNMDYGVDKNGNKRDNNVLNTFDVTILNGGTKLPFKKGDRVALEKFIPEKSYAIGFDLLLRFENIRKIGD